MRRLGATYDPDTLRQLAQWQRYMSGNAKISSLMVTLMLPQRQVADMDLEKWSGEYCFGSPVNGFLGGSGVVIVAFVRG